MNCIDADATFCKRHVPPEHFCAVVERLNCTAKSKGSDECADHDSLGHRSSYMPNDTFSLATKLHIQRNYYMPYTA